MSDILADRLAGMPASRRALFEALTRRAAPETGTEPDGPIPRPDGRPGVLSFAQRRLWFVDQLRPGSPAYNVPVATRIHGPLDAARLRDALQALLDRHEVLRTVYPAHDDSGASEPVPQVLHGYRLPLPVTDVDGEAGLRRFFDADAGAPFDLAGAVPVRASLARLGPEEHVLLLNLHHIVTDGWSMRLLYTELEHLYASGGATAGLPALPIQYGDFAAWQRRRVDGDRLTRLKDFWTGELDGVAPTDLPTDRPRPAVFDHAGESSFIELPADLIARLRERGRAEGATLYMTLLAGFAAVVARYTGSDDVIVGTSVAGRDHPAVSDLIGFFVNTLPLRIRTGGDPEFRELVRRTRTTTLSAYAHQELPFDLIVDALRIPRDPSRPPLTSVMFLLDDALDTAPKLPGLRTEPVDFDAGTAKYDLMISVHDAGSSVRAMVQYPSALFDAETIEALLGHFLTLLEAAAGDPGTRLSRLPLLGGGERERILHDWNDTAAEFPGHLCLHRLFEERADAAPEATALRCAGTGETVAYRDLDERANRLAHHLIAHGVRPDQPVALALRRGVDLVVAVLAVLKAGGAYVPLDPGYPPERLAFMVRDAQAPIVITRTELLGGIPADAHTVRVLLDADHAEIAARPHDRPDSGVTSRHLAYVIYTSGSTGPPKGIALEHRGVVNNLLDLNGSHGIGPGDAVLSLSSPSFDMSVYEILGMLGAGGTLVLPDPVSAKDPAHWAELIVRHGVTVWNSAPSLLGLLLDQLEHAGGPALPLKVAFLGGDWIPVAQPGRIRAFAPGLAFTALGGATEASIHSTVFHVGDVDPEWRSIPYGRPMANQRTYILDERSRPVPAGVPGELHLGGVGLARGYLNRPELTQERFVVVETEPGRPERLYRTGDIARHRRDGVLELLGRTDFRIKLNGLRIEPGEVESGLRALPGVRESVVTTRTDGGSAKLVAYVVPDAGAEPDPAVLRAALGATLPAHAVPSAVVVLDRMPLSPNGKVDRKALPAPGGRAAPGRRPDSGDDPLAASIAAVWRDVIGTGAIGLDDDFFAAGGDSFAAVRAIRAVEGDLRVVELFTHPTPRRLAARIRALREAPGEGPEHTLLHRLTPDRPGGPPELTLVCFPHGGGDAIIYRPLAAELPSRIALWAVSPPGHDPARPGPMIPVSEFAELAADEIIRTIRGPYAVYGHCAGVVAALETTRVLEERGQHPCALHLAAAMPEDDPEYSLELERVSTDDDLVAHLKSMDGFDGVLDERDLAAVLRMVRHDMTEAARFFARTPDGYQTRLSTPLTCIIGDADDATAGYAEGHLAWGRYAREVGLSVIPGGRHYFAKHLPEQLAELLTEIHRLDRYDGGDHE
ncbi:non-ribosomal peptide synthetase [Rhizohabitans arisaemae]|uniref:non-ribosomal peptide synthetase n=1 Tax=Rhizohabitans arisaemae TaxID=2720610 RepID=UPI0024B0BDE5|nr:amino acid adenylation domain-containing protein [Rhizohabitans arisaemae]